MERDPEACPYVNTEAAEATRHAEPMEGEENNGIGIEYWGLFSDPTTAAGQARGGHAIAALELTREQNMVELARGGFERNDVNSRIQGSREPLSVDQEGKDAAQISHAYLVLKVPLCSRHD